MALTGPGSTRSLDGRGQGSLVFSAGLDSGMMTRSTPDKVLAERAFRRRAIEAAIWGLPLVSYEASRQAYVQDAGARYGDIVFCSRTADWKFQLPSANAAASYACFHLNLDQGPMVVTMPAAPEGTLCGFLRDVWQTPLADLSDGGEGDAMFLVMPEGSSLRAPTAYRQVRSPTRNVSGVVQVVTAGDVNAARTLIRGMRVYPLAQAELPPEQRYIDVTRKLYDGVVRFDDSFYDSLARMIEEEQVQPRDLAAMGQLDSIGIGRGQTFKPTYDLRQALKDAVAEAHAGIIRDLLVGTPYWPRSHWITHSAVGQQTGFTFQTADRLWLDERALASFLGAGPSGWSNGSLTLTGVHDAMREPLEGGRRYLMRAPPDPPVRDGWAVTVYDQETAAFIQETPRAALSSLDPGLKRNEDGSLDICFGPIPPVGRESNWIYTQPGRRWFCCFRFLGPRKPLLDRSWMLSEIEPMLGEEERAHDTGRRR